MNGVLIGLLVVVVSGAGGFALCLISVILRWIKQPPAPAVHMNLQIDERVMIDYMRARGYRVEIEKRLVN